MIRYLLDTSICIEMIRRKPAGLLSRLAQCRVGEVGISAVTYAELEYGVGRSGDPARNTVALARFCAPLAIMDFDDGAARAYGQVRCRLEQSGTPIGPLDTLIAAHAMALKAVIVTANEREFRRVKGLAVENWAESPSQ